jgi:carbon monoxide dehydrogenase subunit G
MDFNGQVTIAAPRQKVWEFLTDPHAVSQCAPGLESIKVVAPDQRFEVVAAIGFGTVKVRFVTDVEWMTLEAPKHASMKAHGTAPGSAVDVLADMTMSDGQEGSTDLSWSAQVTVSGTITSLASRLMGSVTKKITTAFFDCVKKKIEG